VTTCSGIISFNPSEQSKSFLLCPIDSCSLIAAFPVGAASMIFKGISENSCNNARILTTVVVFPVPGPPVIIVNGYFIAVIAASFCQLILSITGKYRSNTSEEPLSKESAPIKLTNFSAS
jgi:hypothetical protein